MKQVALTVYCALTLGYAVVPAHAYDLMDAAPLLRDVNAAHPGLETIMPFIVNTGTWSGDVPLSHSVSFRVYPAGASGVLYSSASRSIAPPRPCTNPTHAWYETKTKVVALPGSSWTHLVEEHNVGCTEAQDGVQKEDELVFVYSANLDAAGGGVWSRTIMSRWLDAFQGVDTDDDGVLDALLLVMPFANSRGGYSEHVAILNASDGSVISSTGYENERYLP